eukprot:m.118488 g.118488  ORF g.118488 m.118488 type:complete len:882 (-) comp14278_c0_seq1:5300-7945(-)
MATEYIKTGWINKRSQGKNLMSFINWKERYLMLTTSKLAYYTDEFSRGQTPQAAGAEEKGMVTVSTIRAVEMVPEKTFSRPGVFQVVYDETKETQRILYIESPNALDWIREIRRVAIKASSSAMLSKVHFDVFDGRKWKCCNMARTAPGCINATVVNTGGDGPAIPGRIGQSVRASSRSSSGNVSRSSHSGQSFHTNSVSSNFEDSHPRGASKSVRRTTTAYKSIENESWFIPGATKPQTKILQKMDYGSFVLRESSAASAKYTVDIRVPEDEKGNYVLSKRIKQKSDGQWEFEGEKQLYPSIRLLLASVTKPQQLKLPPDFLFENEEEEEEPVIQAPPTKVFRSRARQTGRDIYEENFQPLGPPKRPSEVRRESKSSQLPIYEDVGDEFANSVRPKQGRSAMEAFQMQKIIENREDTLPRGRFNSQLMNVRAKGRLWKEQPNVKSNSGYSKLSKQEIQRQELIFELVYSEAAFVQDVTILLNVFINPLKEKGILNHHDHPWLRSFFDSTLKVKATSQRLWNALREKQQENWQVDDVSKVLNDHVSSIGRAFYKYCEHVTDTSTFSREDSHNLSQFLEKAHASEEAKGLTFNAYLLTPIQRLARYPMILSDIDKHCPDGSDLKNKMVACHSKWKSMASTCDKRLDEIKNWYEMKDIENTMDYSELHEDDIEHVWEQSHPYGHRMLIKRGVLRLSDMDGKKVKKKKMVEVLLFTDLFMYARIMKVKKTGVTRYVVFKQIHRTLLKAENYNDMKDQKIIKMVLHDPNGEPTYEYFEASSKDDRDRWIEAIHPQTDEGTYEDWNMPEFEVLQDFEPSQPDELPLRRGQRIAVEKRGDNFMRGRILDLTGDAFPTYVVSGWFPSNYVKEVESKRKLAREAMNRAY